MKGAITFLVFPTFGSAPALTADCAKAESPADSNAGRHRRREVRLAKFKNRPAMA